MTASTRQFRLSALSVAIFAATTGAVHAQEEAAQSASEPEVIEEVRVTGIRGSIQRSINDKRESGNIVDTINAEDIGKTTDQNIAEALSRVTGVSAQTVDGEGTTITVRGANAQQNNIAINGVQLGATDFSQAVDLSSFSADVLARIEVVKTPSADHDEGALGANINLVTVRPLDSEDVVSISAQGRYNDLASEQDHKLSVSVSQAFLDNTFGFTATVFDETNTVRKDQFRRDNFIARQSSVATDTDGNVVNDVWGILPYNSYYELFENERNRHGANLGLQWAISEQTELLVNYSYSEQELFAEMHQVKTRAGDYGNFVNGVIPGVADGTQYPTWTDPQADWHTIDLDTNSFVKYLNRNALGDLSHSTDRFSNVNNVASIDLRHNFTDALRLNVGVSSSKAEQIPDESLYLNLQNYNRINPWLLQHTSPDDIEPVGYDCTSGRCELVAGSGVVDYGALLHPDPNALWDNRSTTGFNPDDLEAQHLAYLARTVRDVGDTQNAAYFDIDWDIDFAGVTGLEFGAKWSDREKYVDNQTGSFQSVGEGVVVINPETGAPYTIINGITDISASFVQDGSFPVSDFMSSLGYGTDAITDGWTTVSARRAFETALGNPAAEFVPDDTETRSAKLDNFAVYMKANFSYLDDRLTGDVGVRYVKTTVDTEGFSGVNFHFDPGNVGRVLDPFVLRELRNSANPACPAVPFYGTDWNEEVRWARVDGLGYDTLGTNDKRDDVALPDVGNCYDSFAERGNMEEWWLWRYSDISTERNYVYGPRQYDADGNLVATEDRSQRSFGVTGEHDYDMLLPSLNLNYVITDDLVGRFALSKTMSRPQIDSLRPGFKVTETVWGGNNRTGNTITLTNTKLDPLESNNLDLALEWYFDEGSILAAGLFYKDMSNFEESETLITYMDDLRDLGLDPNAPAYNVNDLIQTAGNLNGCMPKRIQGQAEYDEDWLFSDDLEDLCAQFRTTRIKNGGGASIRGAEFQFMHTFSNLPGIFAGIGTQINYTYQDSAYDQEVSSLDPNVILPELPVAFTPEHSYNAMVYWEMNGHQIRLAYQGTSDQLVQRSWEQGSLWQDGRGTFDLSAAYQITDNLALTFNAVNLTDESVRTYFTSRFLMLDGMAYDEGSPIDGNATQSRTASEYKTGRTYRLGINYRF